MPGLIEKVPLNKRSSLMLLAVSLAFVGTGILLATYAGIFQTRNPEVIRAVGILIAFFFGLGVVESARKYLQSSPGLRFDSIGFYDCSSYASAGRVEWKEVSGFRVRTIDTQKYLSVELKDPARLLKNGPLWIRWIRVANLKLFGSPVQISSHSLAIGFEELVQTFESYARKADGET